MLWVPDAADTTIDVRGRIVATPVLEPVPAAIRANSYTFASRYADAAVNGTTARFARRGAAAILLVANAAVDSAFDCGRPRPQPRHVRRRQRACRGPPDWLDAHRATPGVGRGRDARLPRARRHARDTCSASRRSSSPFASNGSTTPSVNVIGVVRGTDPALRDEYVCSARTRTRTASARRSRATRSTRAPTTTRRERRRASPRRARSSGSRASARVLFINHGAEERGLIGSRYHAAHPVVPLAQIVAVLNGDMIGRNHPDSASLLGAQPPHRNSSDLVAMALQRQRS